jgi:pilus assembly protein CpaE
MARDHGQASVELLAVLPALVACTLIAAHAVGAGWAYWSAANAARAGARAELVGRDSEQAARDALPGPLRSGASIEAGDRVSVRVRVPALVPGFRLPLVAAASGLDAG